MNKYTPEPFPPAFPAAFDPRVDVYEVVERLASGTLRVASSSWQIWDVAPAQLAPGLEHVAGARVLGVLEAALPAHLWSRLLQLGRATAPSLRLEPLRPNRTELAFPERWFRSLRAARL